MGFLQLHRKGFCRRLCRRGVLIDPSTHFTRIAALSFCFSPCFLVSYVFGFCCVFSEGDLIKAVLIASDCGEEDRINPSVRADSSSVSCISSVSINAC
jgi:hypothetical protein